MQSGKNVRPKRWSRVIDLYDDGNFSAIWGSFDNSADRILGVRWNGDTEEDIGYPSLGGNPLWFVQPSLLWYATLITLLQKSKSNPNLEKYIDNILIAIKECPSK